MRWARGAFNDRELSLVGLKGIAVPQLVCGPESIVQAGEAAAKAKKRKKDLTPGEWHSHQGWASEAQCVGCSVSTVCAPTCSPFPRASPSSGHGRPEEKQPEEAHGCCLTEKAR